MDEEDMDVICCGTNQGSTVRGSHDNGEGTVQGSLASREGPV